jgi:hypothetical protein
MMDEPLPLKLDALLDDSIHEPLPVSQLGKKMMVLRTKASDQIDGLLILDAPDLTAPNCSG